MWITNNSEHFYYIFDVKKRFSSQIPTIQMTRPFKSNNCFGYKYWVKTQIKMNIQILRMIIALAYCIVPLTRINLHRGAMRFYAVLCGSTSGIKLHVELFCFTGRRREEDEFTLKQEIWLYLVIDIWAIKHKLVCVVVSRPTIKL